MRICKITNIKPDGKPWESQYGLMYPFYVVLEDGGAGTANSKTEQPAYKVGDTVGYEVTGHTPKGAPKLKITRNPKPGEGTVWVPDTNPDLEAAQPTTEPQPAPQQSFRPSPPQPRHPEQPPLKTQGTPVHGATAGGALARAVDIWLAINGGSSAWNPASVSEVEQITRDLVGIQQRIETGESVPF